MDNTKKFRNILFIVGGVCLVLLILIKFSMSYQDNKPSVDNDIVKFKQEYESLNNTKNDNDKEYLNVNIDEDSKIIYKSDEEIIDVLEKGTGVIYFGFDTCPWCRSMIETLFKSVNNNKINNFYYVDIKDIRSSYKVLDKELSKEVLGTKSYYRILELLDNYLEEYIITEGEEEYDTKEKRLYAPTVVVVKEGDIVGFHSGTVDSQEDPYKGLNDDEKKELEDIYNKMLINIKSGTCKEKTGC